jgi:hypothetical protein
MKSNVVQLRTCEGLELYVWRNGGLISLSELLFQCQMQLKYGTEWQPAIMEHPKEAIAGSVGD